MSTANELHQPEIVDQPTLGLATAQRIDIRQSPYLDTFCGHHTARVTIDSGATGNMIRHSTALRLGCEIKSSSQSAHQADGTSPLAIIGETTVRLTRKNHTFSFCGLVVKYLDVEVLAGTPFMEVNDVTIRPAKRIITLSDGTTTRMIQPMNLSTYMQFDAPTCCERPPQVPRFGLASSWK